MFLFFATFPPGFDPACYVNLTAVDTCVWEIEQFWEEKENPTFTLFVYNLSHALKVAALCQSTPALQSARCPTADTEYCSHSCASPRRPFSLSQNSESLYTACVYFTLRVAKCQGLGHGRYIHVKLPGWGEIFGMSYSFAESYIFFGQLYSIVTISCCKMWFESFAPYQKDLKFCNSRHTLDQNSEPLLFVWQHSQQTESHFTMPCKPKHIARNICTILYHAGW